MEPIKMQKRINKPTWAPSVYVKDMSAYRNGLDNTPDEKYKYVRTYIDEYGLTLVYAKIAENPRFRYKHYFSASAYLYASDIKQGMRLSNIISEELKNGYKRNAEIFMRRIKIKSFKKLIDLMKKAEEKQLRNERTNTDSEKATKKKI